MIERKDISILFPLYIVAILISSIGFGRIFEDSISYLALVDWFRGGGELVPPFCYRPTIPLIASFLPIDPVLSISIISLGFLLALTTMIYLICVQIGVSKQSAFIATLIATISYPVMTYGAVVLLDSSYIFFMSLAVYLMLHPKTRDKWYIILVVIMVGVWFKESAAFASLAYIFYRRNWRQAPFFIIGPALSYVGCRLFIGMLTMEGAQDFWIPRLGHFIEGLPLTAQYLGVSLVGFSWILIAFLFSKIQKEHYRWLLSVGGAMSLLSVYAMTSASFDGRFVWPVYLMLTPLAGLIIDDLIEKYVHGKKNDEAESIPNNQNDREGA